MVGENMGLDNYTLLGVVGYSDRGSYSSSVTYEKGNVVYYKGSSFVCLKDNIVDVTPISDDDNWRYMAHGFEAQTTDEVYIALMSSAWSDTVPYTQTVNASGVSASDNPLVLINANDTAYTGASEQDQTMIEAEFGYIKSIETLDGSIKATCTFRKPSVDIPIILRGH